MKIAPLDAPFLGDDATYTERIRAAIGKCLGETNLDGRTAQRGKVRDIYDLGGQLAIVTTDRQSAFDRVLAEIPFKGQVLNQTALWWFERTESIVHNHVVGSPDPNLLVATKCEPFPVEFVVRGYITGSTSTSLWPRYRDGAREYCGNTFPDGLRKNEKLSAPALTPTTKEVEHDRPISAEEIVSEGLMTAEDWGRASQAALELFAYGQKVAEENGLILVDTKYEMGLAPGGNLTLIDEIHTPDSSRYWIRDSYEERFAAAEDPENIDKEFLRRWFADNCDPYKDEVLPAAPDELVLELSRRYIFLYEKITGIAFQFPDEGVPANERIDRNFAAYLGG